MFKELRPATGLFGVVMAEDLDPKGLFQDFGLLVVLILPCSGRVRYDEQAISGVFFLQAFKGRLQRVSGGVSGLVEMSISGGEVRYVVSGEDFEFMGNCEAVVLVEDHCTNVGLLSIGFFEGIR